MALRQNQAGFLPSVPSGGCSRAHLVLFQVNEAPISEVITLSVPQHRFISVPRGVCCILT